MPVTLAQAKLNATDDIDVQVIDEFRKESAILDAITFDDVVNPAGGGGTLTYGYTRLLTQPTADFRAINTEYTPAEVTKQRVSVDLKPLGGAFQIDRVLARVGPAAANEVVLQMQQKIKATRTRFQDEVINGDTAVDSDGFDGLDKALAGSTTEMNAATVTDWTGVTSQDDSPHEALDLLDLFLSLLDGPPSMILANKFALAKIRSIARRAGYYSRDRNEFGRPVETYGGIALVDPGEKAGTNDPIIPVETRDPDGAGAGGNVTGLTDIYAVRFGIDGFHALSMAGAPLVQTWLPDFDRAGAVKTGEVEMGPVAVALKATRAAAVLRNVKIQ
jgi:hypothetical protein